MRSKDVIDLLGIIKNGLRRINSEVEQINFWNGGEKKLHIRNDLNELINSIEILEKREDDKKFAKAFRESHKDISKNIVKENNTEKQQQQTKN